MDRRTFVKIGCISSASLLVEGLDPMMRADAVPPALPPIELHGLPNYKPSPLGMPGLFPGRVIEVRDQMRSFATACRSRLYGVCSTRR